MKVICDSCHQPFHGLTHCNEAASLEIKRLLAQASDLHERLRQVEQALYDLDYNAYCYITGVIKRKSETKP